MKLFRRKEYCKVFGLFLLIGVFLMIISERSKSTELELDSLSEFSRALNSSQEIQFFAGFVVGFSVQGNSKFSILQAASLLKSYEEHKAFQLWNYLSLMKTAVYEIMGTKYGKGFAQIVQLEVLDFLNPMKDNIIEEEFAEFIIRLGFWLFCKTVIFLSLPFQTLGQQVILVKIGGLLVETTSLYSECFSEQRMLSCGRRVGSIAYEVVNLLVDEESGGIFQSLENLKGYFSLSFKRFVGLQFKKGIKTVFTLFDQTVQ
eukprot:TRINITY_DN2384_c0_g1_i2.p1 TRINITY_DN2384_c0_g1~~TRINITY_DN2384_c0_g1_i2.p1  ORF type:complete len:259 (+),score=4.79 TRINITY_DN2384_c0_g1_i2:101-877(+)